MKEDTIEDTTIEVLECETVRKRLEINEEEEAGNLDDQRTQTRVALNLCTTGDKQGNEKHND